ncbi:3174_t:CDS:10, partial [Funneliformis geosporum]
MTWYKYFDENETKTWTIYKFHRDWIRTYEENDENLTYSKAVDTLAKSLREIANKSSDPAKIRKANNLLKARGVTLLAGPLTDLLDCYGNNLDKLWLSVEKKEVLREKNINTGTNCIQLVSCEGIQISNIGQKRGHDNEELATPETKKLSVDFSESDDKHQEDDDEVMWLESPIVKRLREINGIARYRIIFLPEENECNPIKSSFTEQEWLKFEADWQKVEERLVVNSGVNECIEGLLNKYDDAINKATTGYSVNLNRIIGTFNECTLIDRHHYSFSKEWPLQWIQSVYNAFLAVNPLHNADLSEYAYRDKIVNTLIENVFLDINEVIFMRTGEIENNDRKIQKDSSRSPGVRRATVGNACEHDDAKMERDREKILKSMQLGLFRLRQSLQERGADENNFNCAETFGILVYKKDYRFYSMHYANGIYLVDKFDEFAIPSSVSQLCELSEIIRSLLSFKNRVIKLHDNVQNLFGGKRRFIQKSRHY